MTAQEYVLNRWPEVKDNERLFNILVALQKFNPEVDTHIEVLDWKDELKRRERLDTVATQVKIQGGEVRDNYLKTREYNASIQERS